VTREDNQPGVGDMSPGRPPAPDGAGATDGAGLAGAGGKSPPLADARPFGGGLTERPTRRWFRYGPGLREVAKLPHGRAGDVESWVAG
jgi:hypothetical protein